MTAERCCWHAFARTLGVGTVRVWRPLDEGGWFLSFCCRAGCKNVIASQHELEEKTHGSPLFGGDGPLLTISVRS